MLFLPVHQELDCISDNGSILGRIKYDHSKAGHVFYSDNEFSLLLPSEQASIAEYLSGLDSGKYTIPMADDD